MPIVGYYTPVAINVLLLFLLYSFLIANNKFFFKDLLLVLPVYSIAFVSLLLGDYDNISIWIYTFIQKLIYTLIALYLIRHGEKKIIKRIFYVIMFSYIVTCVTTYIGCINFPGASRLLAKGLKEEPALYALLMNSNVGGFNFIYTLVLFTPVVLFIMREKMESRLLCGAILFLFAVVIITSEYATALIGFLLAFISLFFHNNLKIKHLVFLSVFLLAVYYAGGKTLIGHSFEYLADNVESEMVSNRLHNLSVGILEGENKLEGDVEARMDYYQMSLDAFLENPITGSRTAELGGHSYILDKCARYGILGIAAIIIMLLRLYKLFYKPYVSHNFYGSIIFTYLISILFMFVNTKANLMVTSFLIPLFIISYKQNNYDYENSLGR